MTLTSLGRATKGKVYFTDPRVFEGHVYFVIYFKDASDNITFNLPFKTYDNALARVPIGGGPLEEIAPMYGSLAKSSKTDLNVDASGVYYRGAVIASNQLETSAFIRLRIGQTPRPEDLWNIRHVWALDSTYLYTESDYELDGARKDHGGYKLIASTMNQPQIVDLAVNQTTIYRAMAGGVVDGKKGYSIRRIELSDLVDRPVVVPSSKVIQFIAANSTNVYWHYSEPASAGGYALATIKPGETTPKVLAHGDGPVYFNAKGSFIGTTRTQTGGIIIAVDGPFIAADETDVFWIAKNKIMKVPAR